VIQIFWYGGGVCICDKVFLFLHPLLWILLPLLGLNGVWLATSTAEFLMFLVVLSLLWKEFGFLKNGKTVSKATFPCS